MIRIYAQESGSLQNDFVLYKITRKTKSPLNINFVFCGEKVVSLMGRWKNRRGHIEHEL